MCCFVDFIGFFTRYSLRSKVVPNAVCLYAEHYSRPVFFASFILSFVALISRGFSCTNFDTVDNLTQWQYGLHLSYGWNHPVVQYDSYILVYWFTLVLV